MKPKNGWDLLVEQIEERQQRYYNAMMQSGDERTWLQATAKYNETVQTLNEIKSLKGAGYCG